MLPKFLSALLFLSLLYFVYFGLVKTPFELKEVDSLTYHIPLAESFAKGDFINLCHIRQGLGFYPGVGEIILSLFMKLRIPLGFFNILALILLFFGLKRLGKSFKLKKDISIIFAASFCFLPTILRLVPVQKNDIWLAVFFVYSFVFLKAPKSKISYFIKLGILLGALIGIKYSGILVAISLLVVFWKDIKKYINFRNSLALFSPILIIGGFWYLRNYILFENPFYPVGLFSFRPHHDFINIIWDSLIRVSLNKGDFLLITQAFLSEFLFWSFAPLIVCYFLIKKGKSISGDIKKLGFLSFFLCLSLLPQPAGSFYQSAVSLMRFFYPFMITVMLLLFIIAREFKFLKLLSFMAVLSSMAVLPQFDYYPKLIIIWLLVIGLLRKSVFKMR
jgi:hypothetical protein